MKRTLFFTRVLGQILTYPPNYHLVKENYSDTLQDAQSKYLDVLAKDRAQIDSITRENDQLKSFISTKPLANNLNDLKPTLGSALDSHLDRMQNHTEELRRDIFAGASPTA